jgi:hypothetical protein
MSLTIIDSNEVSITPVIINPIGTKMAERVASIMANAHGATALALINEKGTIGKQARERAASGGMVGIVQHCASGNYTPVAEFMALKLNAAILVRSRAEYNLLPTILDMRIMDAEGKGTAGGEKTAAKLRGIKAELVEIMAAAEELYQAKKAQREADAAKQVANA